MSETGESRRNLIDIARQESKVVATTLVAGASVMFPVAALASRRHDNHPRYPTPNMALRSLDREVHSGKLTLRNVAMVYFREGDSTVEVQIAPERKVDGKGRHSRVVDKYYKIVQTDGGCSLGSLAVKAITDPESIMPSPVLPEGIQQVPGKETDIISQTDTLTIGADCLPQTGLSFDVNGVRQTEIVTIGAVQPATISLTGPHS